MTDKDNTTMNTDESECEWCGEMKNCINWRETETLFTLWRFEVKYLVSSDRICEDCAIEADEWP